MFMLRIQKEPLLDRSAFCPPLDSLAGSNGDSKMKKLEHIFSANLRSRSRKRCCCHHPLNMEDVSFSGLLLLCKKRSGNWGRKVRLPFSLKVIAFVLNAWNKRFQEESKISEKQRKDLNCHFFTSLSQKYSKLQRAQNLIINAVNRKELPLEHVQFTKWLPQ